MTIEPVRIGQLLVYAILLALGQVFFKLVALKSEHIRSVESAALLLKQPYFWGAMLLYGIATVLWVYLLQRMSLAVAYAFVAVVFVLVPIGGWLLFGERLTWPYAIGTVLIMAGVIVIGSTAT